MGKLDNAGAAYFEGLAADKFGVDWRQKRAMLEAQTRGVDATTKKTGADTLKTEADTRKVGVETADSQFDLQEKKRKLAELQAMVASGKLPATQLEAVQALIAMGQADIAKAAAPGNRAHVQAETNQANATADYMRRRSDGTPQGSWMSIMKDGKLMRWNAMTGEVREAPTGATDLATGRAAAGDERAMGTFDQLLAQTDGALKRYEATMTGMSRGVPSMLNPEKAVARQGYESKLGELAQVFGRTALRDNRVSDQDRQVYTAAIGQASEVLMTYDPSEARKRLNDLIALNEHYKRKYANPGANLQPLTSHGSAPAGDPAGATLDSLFGPKRQ